MHARCYFFSLSFAAFLHLSFYNPNSAMALDAIQVINPKNGTLIIERHLDIQTKFRVPVDHDSLVVLLDDNDITAMVEFTKTGFHCKVPMQLAGGSHVLYIAGNGPEGPFEQESIFSSKQNSIFEQASTSNEWSINLQAGSFHSNIKNDTSAISLDSTWQHESNLTKGNWKVTLTAGARLLEESYSSSSEENSSLFSFQSQDGNYGPREESSSTYAQNQGSIDPEREGLDLNNMLMRGQYENNSIAALVEIGDLQIKKSKNTFANLARNGGQLSVDLDKIYFSGFSVFGKDTFGIHDGIGIGFDNDDHLYGFSGGFRLLNEQIDMLGFYIDGGQKENSYASWSEEQGNSGNVFGIVIKTNFIKDLLVTEFEYDRSDYDPNTDDEFSSSRAEAYRFEVSGQDDIFNYDITYERFDPEYNVPGNLSPKQDYAGITANGSLMFDVHSLGFMAGVYHDNVNKNPLYARTNSYMGQLDYYYYGITSFPVGFSFQHTADMSTDEPAESPETNLTTDTFSFNTGYTPQGPFTLNVTASYSWQDDDADQDADLATLSFTLSPTLTLDTMSVTLSGTVNQNRDMLSGNRTDDYVVTLDMMGSIFTERLTYYLGGTYDHSLITDDSSDRHGLTGYSRLAWTFDDFIGLTRPTLGVELQYNSDAPQGVSTTEETRIYCTLSTSIPFNY